MIIRINTLYFAIAICNYLNEGGLLITTKLKKTFICITLAVALSIMNILPAMAVSSDISSISSNDYSISWEGTLLEKVTVNNVEYTYTYNGNSNRIQKTSKEGTIVYNYDNECRLISETRGTNVFKYQYDSTNYIVGFTLNGVAYKYVKDDNLSIIAITDSNNEYIAKYQYDDKGIVYSILGKNEETDNWIDMSEDESFIGTLNLIRLHSYYFDSETSWYYNGKYYFDSINNKYVVNSVVQEGISVCSDSDVTASQLAIENWCNNLMADSSFGVAITYTSGWYSSLSDVELIARLIYGENTVNIFDQDAVARVLTNRKNANETMFGGNTYRGVATKAAQFEPITGGSSGTANARVPDTSKATWSNAVLVACCLLSSPSTTDYNYFITKPSGISTQLYFVGLNYFMDNATENMAYNFGGSTYYYLEDVVIVFTESYTLPNPGTKSVITGVSELDSYQERSTHNIFFNY